MNDSELEKFEAELRNLKPAALPGPLLQSLVDSRPKLENQPARSPRLNPGAVKTFGLSHWLRWLIPATAVVVGGMIAWVSLRSSAPNTLKPATAPPSERLVADDISVERQLVSTYDAIAELPTGEPVRFNCREWMDEVNVRDSSKGLVIQKRIPRVEITPVRFETY